jgi:formamidopyrimidine-DNA glycosylase
VERLMPLLIGRRFLTPRRRGKFLLLDLEPPGSLLVHLGMTGRIQLIQASVPRRDHTHLVIHLSDGRQLRFVDPRRFGLVDWLDPGAETRDRSLALLGVEPLDPGLDEVLPPKLHARRAPLKSLLLDQRMVAGVGNIYAAEALWRAGIHPRRAGNRTSRVRLEGLARAVQEVLSDAVAQGGTTLRDFAGPDGEAGYFAVQLNVYGRQGEPCAKCGATIRAAVIGGRTTAWCPKCQR